MSNVYKDRYGIPGTKVKNLARRYYRYLHDSEWATFDEFLMWASKSGYQSGLRLVRRDKTKPHGPSNSMFSSRKMIKDACRKRATERKTNASPFCDGCTGECSNSAVGCKIWKSLWIKNWNKNIYIPPVEPLREDPNEKKYFRYELPDLVREGILWTG